MRLNFIAALILSIIVASFAIVNSKIVTINLLFSKVSVSQALVIFISVAVGAIIALLFGLVKEIKLKRQLKEKKKELKDLEQEKKNLKQELQITPEQEEDLEEQDRIEENKEQKNYFDM
ncbi:LapA family protein [Halanaerobacter jeridensis]|uniref:Integral membrane protein n=1 Tax=Halanaerobacter jeridensis TaxID=706427 RepID=A0A938XRG6_9FIRM|nr:LapA family protein [Halanaerobacter jeridensis]MBM7555439.1 putative integral membrane protein [Halanaerobacter jeridensis]